MRNVLQSFAYPFHLQYYNRFFVFNFHDFSMLIINVNILDYWNFLKLFQGYLYPMARRMPVRLEKWRSGKEKSITFVPDLLFLYPAVHVIAVSPV